MIHPKLRDGKKLQTNEPFPINILPDDLLVKIGGCFAHLMYIGRKDITGTDWGDAFANAIGGIHLDSPIGIADVVLGKMAWSMKTVKNRDPFSVKSVRLISGRCSPDYSYGITDPHKDIQKTGTAVLGIWNERINIAQDNFTPLRTSILIRSEDLTTYCIYEEETHRYATNEYVWELNSNGNLIGKNIETGNICFTWQPHGSQFTIHSKVPANATKFKIKRPPTIRKDEVLKAIGFDDSWVTIIRQQH